MLCQPCLNPVRYSSHLAKLALVVFVVSISGNHARAQVSMGSPEMAAGVLPLEVKLGSLNNRAMTLKSDLTITNPNGFAIRQIEIMCDVFASSGGMVQRYQFTIREAIPAKGQLTIKNHAFGYWPVQATSITCEGNRAGHF
jgi:hypothetical protein